MEIFGSTFDDSVFTEARDRVFATVSTYNAKSCEPAWFRETSALDSEDALDKQKVYKFRGDLSFWQGNYQEALEAYGSCLQWIPDNNLSIRRDVVEGMARCCTQLGQREPALEYAAMLSKDASNTCHLMSLLLLKVAIHRHFGAVDLAVASLQQLCSLLPFNPWHWHSLSQACLQLLASDRNPTLALGSCLASETAGDENGGQTEGETECGADGVWLMACMCFVRTRLLLRVLQQQQSSFVLEKSKSALQRTDEALQQLNPKEGTLQILEEVMSEDLVPEKMREDNQDGESLANLCVQSFSQRWWSKSSLRQLLQTDGPTHRTHTGTQP